MKQQEKLASEGIYVRVVSMPSMDLFEKQSKEYRESIHSKTGNKTYVIEMGATYGWHKYVGFEELSWELIVLELLHQLIKLLKHYGLRRKCCVIIQRNGVFLNLNKKESFGQSQAFFFC